MSGGPAFGPPAPAEVFRRPAEVPTFGELVAGRGHRLFFAPGRQVAELRCFRPIIVAHALDDNPMGPGHLGWYWMRDDEREIPATRCVCGDLFFHGRYPICPLLGGTYRIVQRGLFIRAAAIMNGVASPGATRRAAAGVRQAEWWIAAARDGLDGAIEEYGG